MEVEIKAQETQETQPQPQQPIVVVEQNPEPIQELKQEVKEIQQNLILEKLVSMEMNLMNRIQQLEAYLQNALESLGELEEAELEVQEIPVAPLQEAPQQEIPKQPKKLGILELLAGGKPRTK